MASRSPRFSRPAGLFLFAVSSLFSQSGNITTVAGNGTRGFSGDGGPATLASLALANLQNQCDPNQFEQTVHLFVDSSRNLYLADSENQRIRRISPDGVITTVAGSGERPQTNTRCEPTGTIGDGGPAKSARLYNPADVLIHPDGAMIIADQQNNRIRRVAADGVITTIAGSGLHNLYAPGIPAINSPMDWPSSLAVDANGLVHFTEIHGNRVGRIGADGRLATVAGTGFPGYNGDNLAASSAQLKKPTGIAFDSNGNLYIADSGNHRIRKVTPGGSITTVAGTGVASYSGDGGPAVAAALNTPMDVKVDHRGNIFVADTVNNRVRRIDGAGNISTVADGLNNPAGLAVDPDDNVYVIDWQNYLVRKITFPPASGVAIDLIVNGASLAPAAAPGSLVSIYVSNLAVDPVQAPSAPWPLKLADVSVKVNETPIPLLWVSSNRINAQLPFDTPVGTASVKVISPSGESPPIPFDVAAGAVGIFHFPDSTRAVAINQNSTVNLPSNPERRGNPIAVYFTGSPAAPVSITAKVGGAAAEAQYLDVLPGIAQATVKIPDAAPIGDDVPLILTLGGSASNVVIISVR